MSKSFLDCPHNDVQQYTECCYDCNYNIYMSNEEYLDKLQKKAGEVPADSLPTKLINALAVGLHFCAVAAEAGRSWIRNKTWKYTSQETLKKIRLLEQKLQIEQKVQ